MQRIALALACLVLSGILFFAAWPRLQASLAYLPVDTALGRYFETRVIPGAQLDGLAGRAEAAIARHDHHRYWDGLSQLLYLKGLERDTPVWLREPALYQSLEAALTAVRRAPAQPSVWLRIALLRAALGQPADAVVPPLKMSMLTGRVEPTLLLPRLELAYRFLPWLDAEARDLLRDQTRLAWRISEPLLRDSLASGRLSRDQLADWLNGADPGLWSEMEASLGAD